MVNKVEDFGRTSRPPVGVPIQELSLHAALDRQFGRLFRPGVGRSVFILSEPELGFGRPDGVIIVASSTSLAAFQRRKLRLPSLNAAKSLAGAGTSLTERRSRTLARDLEHAGWSERDLREAAQIIADSLAVEAKLSEWRRAIRQSTTYRIGTGRAAVLLPAHISAFVDERNLESHGVGLLVEQQGHIKWSVAAPRATISISHRAWLVELLLRGFDNGTAHRAT